MRKEDRERRTHGTYIEHISMGVVIGDAIVELKTNDRHVYIIPSRYSHPGHITLT